jgi:hypothetical protein
MLAMLSGCASKSNFGFKEPQLVSIIQLINNPEKYNNKRVGLKGFFNIAIEENVIYLSKADYENANTKNGIWLSVSKEFMKSQNIDPPYNGYISVEGTFLKNKKNSNSHFSGTLTNIDYMGRLISRDSN